MDLTLTVTLILIMMVFLTTVRSLRGPKASRMKTPTRTMHTTACQKMSDWLSIKLRISIKKLERVNSITSSKI
jgi:hypothetical protein